MQDLIDGKLEDEIIEIEVDEDGVKAIGMMPGMGNDDMMFSMSDILGDFLPSKKKKKNLPIKEARKILINQEAEKLIDMDAVKEIGLREAEQNGIIFVDEIDKIVGGGGRSQGPDVSREGVQRDILPIVEGSTVNTKYGPIQTDYILFIGAGAFHIAKVEDMIPELQGRFPITVSLDSLTQEDFLEILKNTDNSVIKQYQALIKTEGIDLIFAQETLATIAEIAFLKNQEGENIGARRLHTVMEKLLEEISYHASEYEQEEFIIDVDYVKNQFKLDDYKQNYDRYLL